jgi:hypothetical protein
VLRGRPVRTMRLRATPATQAASVRRSTVAEPAGDRGLHLCPPAAQLRMIFDRYASDALTSAVATTAATDPAPGSSTSDPLSGDRSGADFILRLIKRILGARHLRLMIIEDDRGTAQSSA